MPKYREISQEGNVVEVMLIADNDYTELQKYDVKPPFGRDAIDWKRKVLSVAAHTFNKTIMERVGAAEKAEPIGQVVDALSENELAELL